MATPSSLKMKLPSGRRLWESADVVGGTPAGSDTAFLVKNGSRNWMFTEKGELVIGKLSPKGYEEIDRAKVIEPTNLAFRRPVVWCAPAYANKQMFVPTRTIDKSSVEAFRAELKKLRGK